MSFLSFAGRARAAALVIVCTVHLVLVSCGGESKDSQAEHPGQRVAESKGCLSCHSVDGSRRAGPTWQGLFGAEVKLTDGTTVVADDDYLARAISSPGTEIVAGYPNAMPTVSLTDQERQEVIDYIKSLGGDR
ncbi:MAG: cytochrome c [Acidimicrobiales bacterium]|nr:cytochrome c [Acidimicrobiales bacterium]